MPRPRSGRSKWSAPRPPCAALARLAGNGAQCRNAQPEQLPAGLLETVAQVCTSPGSPIERLVVAGRKGDRVYAASGLAAYGKALELGIASLASDAVVPGKVEVPITSATDAQGLPASRPRRSLPIRR
jgi:hypothetical protein